MTDYINLVEDTICSLITPPGIAGISVLRVSGSKSVEMVRKLSDKLPNHLVSHTCHFVRLISPTTKLYIDEVVISYFAKGKSFTGDETIEISCHGGNLVWKTILNELTSLGCRLAQRGEFSFRAFYNGKIDLIQAEAIQSLIESNSESAKNISLSQLGGNLSDQLLQKEKILIHILANLEASIDFSTEDIDPYPYSEMMQDLGPVTQFFGELFSSYRLGKKVVEGLKVIVCGPPNVGKSSLFNKLIGEERSIVTDIKGTTRDLVNYDLRLSDGNFIELQDSAGIRETDELVEGLGIQKTKSAILKSDIVFYVVDASEIDLDFVNSIKIYPEQKAFLIFNKVDLLAGPIDSTPFANKGFSEVVQVSAKTSVGIDKIKKLAQQHIEINQNNANRTIVQRRHFELVEAIKSSLSQAEKMLKKQESPDIVSQEIQVALLKLHNLLGKSYDDQIVDSIFKQFCLGK